MMLLLPRVARRPCTVTFLLGGALFNPENADIVDVARHNEQLDQMYTDRSSTTWSQRLSMMWRRDEYDNLSPEVNAVYSTCLVSTFTGVCYGAYADSARVTKLFLEKHKHEMFKHPKEFQSAMRDKMMLSYIKGGTKYGLRMFILAFTYSSAAQSLACVRNYINPLDHMVAGAIMGAVYKFNMGPKGMIGGGFLGSLLGLQGGLVMWLLQYISGETLEQRWSREFAHISNLRLYEALKTKEKDARLEIVKHLSEEGEPVGDLVRTDTQEYLESRDWLRNMVLGLRAWAENNGFINPQELSTNLPSNIHPSSHVISGDSK